MSESTNLPPSDWYPDPEVDGQLRYWDGVQWTEHRAPAVAPRPDKELEPRNAKGEKKPAKAAKQPKPARGVDLTLSDEDYEAKAVEILQRAQEAASLTDVVEEERSIRLALALAMNRRGADGLGEMEVRVHSLRTSGLLTNRVHIGTLKPESFLDYVARTERFTGRAVGQPIEVFEDRIIQAGTVRAIDAYTQAQVYLDGQIQITQRPTLTRMALLSPLPGSALIPGFALQKKEKNDGRTAEFQVGGRDWTMTIPVSPTSLSASRSIAERINRVAESLAAAVAPLQVQSTPSPEILVSTPSDPISQLERIAALKASGDISEEEAAVLKASVLGSESK